MLDRFVKAFEWLIARFVAAFEWLNAHWLPIVMALLALVCLTTAVSSEVRVRDRFLWGALALISAITAWMMVSRWRW